MQPLVAHLVLWTSNQPWGFPSISEPETTTAPLATTPNSVSTVQSSSFIAVIPLPLLLVTSKLLS